MSKKELALTPMKEFSSFWFEWGKHTRVVFNINRIFKLPKFCKKSNVSNLRPAVLFLPLDHFYFLSLC